MNVLAVVLAAVATVAPPPAVVNADAHAILATASAMTAAGGGAAPDLMTALVATGDLDGALAMARRTPAGSRDGSALVVLAGAHAARGDASLAVRLMDEADRREFPAGHGAPPKDSVRATGQYVVRVASLEARYVDALIAAGAFDLARARTTTFAQDIELWRRYCSAGRAIDAVGMLARAATVAGLPRDMLTLIDATIDSGAPEQAMPLIDEAVADGAKMIDTSGMPPSIETGAWLITGAATSYVRLGHTERVLPLMKLTPVKACGQCWERMAWDLAQAGELRFLVRFVASAPAVGQRAAPHAALALAYAKAGDHAAEAREWKRALELEGKQKAPRFTAEFIVDTARRYRAAGLADGAAARFAEAQRLMPQIVDSHRRDMAMDGLALALVSADGGDCAAALAVTRGQDDPSYTLARLADACTDTAAILAELPRVKWDDRRSEVVASVAKRQAASGHVRAALDLCAKIPDAGVRIVTLATIAVSAAHASDVHGADLAQLLEAARTAKSEK